MSTSDFDGGSASGSARDAFDQDDDLRALLRSGDPAGALPPADPAALASLLEDIMSADLDVRPDAESPTPERGRNPLTWLVAAAAAVVIAGAGAFAVSGLGGDDPAPPTAGPETTTAPADTAPGTGADPAPAPAVNEPIAGETTQLSVGPVATKCAVPTPALLAEYPQAFQGQVAAVDASNGKVTLTTTDVFTGEIGETVEITAAPRLIGAMIGAVKFELGGTYNVAVFDGQVAMCGYSGPAAGQTEELFRAAFVR